MVQLGFYCESLQHTQTFLSEEEEAQIRVWLGRGLQWAWLLEAWSPVGLASRGVVSGVEVLGMVPDVLSHEGADEEVAVVVALQEQQESR